MHWPRSEFVSRVAHKSRKIVDSTQGRRVSLNTKCLRRSMLWISRGIVHAFLKYEGLVYACASLV